jgi:pantoate--beta-alanine ligase
VRPTDAYFGTKDLQQCAVISAMIDALKFPIRFHREPTLRDSDGLAMSSRNRYLSSEDRFTARFLPLTQRDILDRIASGDSVEQAILDGLLRLREAGFDVQYLAYIDPLNLTSLSSYQPSGRTIVAAKLGTTRLIDNLGHAESF